MFEPMTSSIPVLFTTTTLGGGGGYSLYSNDRDDRRIFRGWKSAIWYFLGVVQAKFFREIKMVFVRV